MGHYAVLDDFISLFLGVNVVGDIKIGEGAYLGISACAINQENIGEWSIVGDGVAVARDIPPKIVAVGVPARIIKNIGKDGEKKNGS